MSKLLLLLAGVAAGAALAFGGLTFFGDGGSSDAAAAEPSSASGTVFEDRNGDGFKDDGEPGLAGVIVSVRVDDSLVASVLTSPDGEWRVDLPYERFTVEVDETTLPWPAELTTGRVSYDLRIPNGFVAPNVNFGYGEVVPGRVLGVVFDDTNDDGILDDDEPGLPGVDLIATEEDTGDVVTITTDADGAYEFVSPTGAVNHRLRVDTTTLPWPAQLTSGREEYNLNVPQEFFAPNVNFGYGEVVPGRVLGVVFDDTNDDGILDDDEPGLPGVDLIATEEDTGDVVTITTDADGAYEFVSPTGAVNHRLRVDTTTLPWPAQLTSGREEYNLNVPQEFFAPNVNFGYGEVVPGRVLGVVFDDTNDDGILDDDEPGLPGVDLIATEEDTGDVVTITTDADGAYEFVSPTGAVNHRLRVDTTTLPWPAQLTSGREEYNLNVPQEFFAPNVNFGYGELPPAESSGIVFEDLDGDGEQGDGEPGVADVDVVITSDAGPLATVTTDGDGAWVFAGGGTTLTAHVDEATLPRRDDGTVPALTTEPGVHTFGTARGETNTGLDFGYQWVPRPESRLGGSVSEPVPSDPPTPDPSPTETAAPTPESCDLVGVWDLREQPFLDQISALGAGQAPGGGFEATHRSGNYLITLSADGSYNGNRNDWTFGFNTSQGGIVVTIDSDDSGTWSATGDEISISEPAGQATVDLAIEQGGQLVPMPIAPSQTVGTDAIAGTGGYVCRGDVLEVTFEGVTSTLDRVG